MSASLPPQHLGPSRPRHRRHPPTGCRRAFSRPPRSTGVRGSEPRRRAHRELRSPMHDALRHHLQLGPVRNRHWVTAHFGHQ